MNSIEAQSTVVIVVLLFDSAICWQQGYSSLR